MPENESGPETVAVWTALVPFPTKIPASVVEPVPPFTTATVPPSVVCETHTPAYATHPLRRLIPLLADVVAVPNVSAPTIVVEALMVEDALDTKPLENVSVVVVALLGKR